MLASRLAHGTVLLMSLVSQQASCVVDVVDCGLTLSYSDGGAQC